MGEARARRAPTTARATSLPKPRFRAPSPRRHSRADGRCRQPRRNRRPGNMPGPCPSVTLAIASFSRLTKPVSDSRTSPCAYSTPASAPASLSGFELRIGGGRVGAGAERPEQLVQRRHAPAEIGRRAQAEPAAERRNRTRRAPSAASRRAWRIWSSRSTAPVAITFSNR